LYLDLIYAIYAMVASVHTVNDFRIGESVVPLNKSELTLVIVDIIKDTKKIICRSSAEIEGFVFDYKPEELEKEFVIRPFNIILPKPS
jgi:hypothetical protein